MPVGDEQRLTLLSANIQAGNATAKYRDYVTGSWNHVLPGWRKRSNLMYWPTKPQFDIVGLQEADAGSLRSGFMNQTHYGRTRRFSVLEPPAQPPRGRIAPVPTVAPAGTDEVVDYAAQPHPRTRRLLVRYGDGKDR